MSQTRKKYKYKVKGSIFLMLSLSLSLDKNHIIIDGHDQRQTQCRRGWQVPVPKQQCKGVRAAAVERGSRHVQVEIGSLALV